jgi:hypothetical protein
VAISGETAVVGALFDNVRTNVDQGSAYVFVERALCGANSKLTASDGAADDFLRQIQSPSAENRLWLALWAAM